MRPQDGWHYWLDSRTPTGFTCAHSRRATAIYFRIVRNPSRYRIRVLKSGHCWVQNNLLLTYAPNPGP